MIDYVKFEINDVDVQRLKSHPDLEFKSLVNERTGEFDIKTVANYHFCEITIYDNGLCRFSGSLHKLWNSVNGVFAPNFHRVKHYNGYNGNDFGFDHLLYVIGLLERIFGCGPEKMILRNLEFGLNVSIPNIDINRYLKGLLFHKNQMFTFSQDRKYYGVSHQQFMIKIYNKSSQYGMTTNVLRVEIKYKKMKQLQDLNFRTMNCLGNKSLGALFMELEKRFHEVVHFDYTIDPGQLKPSEKKMIDKYNNPGYWIDALKPKNRGYHKEKLVKLTLEKSQNITEQIELLLKQKFVINNRSYKGIKRTVRKDEMGAFDELNFRLRERSSLRSSSVNRKNIYKALNMLNINILNSF